MDQEKQEPGPSRHSSNSDEEDEPLPGTSNEWTDFPVSLKQVSRFYHRSHMEVLMGHSSSENPSPENQQVIPRHLKFDEDLIKTRKDQPIKVPAPLTPKIVITNPSNRSSNGGNSTDENHAVNILEDISNDELQEVVNQHEVSTVSSPILYYLKTFFLTCIWFISCVILMLVQRDSQINNAHQISVPPNITRSYWIPQHPTMRRIQVDLQGAILPTYYANLTTRFMRVWVDLIQTRSPDNNMSEDNILYRETISTVWVVPIVLEDSIDFAPEVLQNKLFDISDIEFEMMPHSFMCLQFNTNLVASFPISVSFDLAPINPEDGIVYATIILISLYFMIITEIVHRTVAAMLAATVTVAVLAMFGERPSHQDIVAWVDLETLTLLFSMMVFVAIASETGVFDYLAVAALRLSCYFDSKYTCVRLSGGKIWIMINLLCFITVLVSSFLDNVTTILLMTPVTIRLCEVIHLDPTPVLMAMIIFSNIGGAITPIGDPPNVIIATNKDVVEAGISFGVFLFRMGVPLLIIMLIVHILLRFMYDQLQNLQPENFDNKELRHEMVIWQRAAASLSSISKDEDTVRNSLLDKAHELAFKLKKQHRTRSVCCLEIFKDDIEELKKRFPIKDKVLLIKSSVSLLIVIITFFLQSVLNLHLSMGSIALLGALLLLLLHPEDIVDVLARVEWSTLIFFTSLFILMEGLSRLGLIDFIGYQTELVIKAVPPDYRLAAAILLILWVSGFASSILDNIPLTTMMIRIAVGLNQSEELGLPLQPLIWALALGACLGGNGTLIGSSSNLVCACVAERHGYKFSFIEFSRIGFPVMMVSLLVATAYLLVTHVWLDFNN